MPLVALYSEVLLNTATPPALQKNQSVTILNSDQVTNATLYADDAGTIGLGNPVTTTSNGTLIFRAVPGTYYPSVGGFIGDPIFVGVPSLELNNPRTPSPHAASHLSSGSDPLASSSFVASVGAASGHLVVTPTAGAVTVDLSSTDKTAIALAQTALQSPPVITAADASIVVGGSPSAPTLIAKVGVTKFDAANFSGIDGTGATDSRAGINAAIASIATTYGGGILAFRPGAFVISSSGGITWLNQAGGPANNVWLQGSGKDVTVLSTAQAGTFLRPQGVQPIANRIITPLVNAGVIDMTVAGPGGLGSTTLVGANWFDHFTLRNVKFTGASSLFVSVGPQNNLLEQFWLIVENCDFIGHTTQSGIESFRLADIEGVRIDKCTWDNFEYTAINLYTQVTNCRITNNKIRNCMPHGFTGGNQPTAGNGIIYKSGSYDVAIENNLFENLYGGMAIVDGGQSGPDNFGYNGVRHVRIRGNEIRYCGGGIEVVGGTDLSVIDNLIEFNQGHGMNVGTSNALVDSVIDDNRIFNNYLAGGSSPAGMYITATAANATNNNVRVRGNRIGDNQGVPTQLWGIALDIKSIRSLSGYTFDSNHLARSQVPVRVVSGTFAANTEFRRNFGYNPLRTLTVPTLNTTSQPITPSFNAEADIYLSGGTVTSILKDSLPTPTPLINATDVTGGGSGFTTGASTVASTFLDGSGVTTALSATAAVTVAAATDQILVSSLPAPTAPVLSGGSGTSSGLPAGTYYVVQTWFNDVGEGPPSPVSNGLTIANGNKFTIGAAAGGTPPAGATGAKFYLVAGSGSVITGLVAICNLGGTGTFTVASFPVNQLPFAIAPPTVAPSVNVISPSGASGGHGGLTAGTYTIGMTYVTNRTETIIGSGTTNVTVTNSQALTFNALNLDSTLSNSFGQLQVYKVRYYAIGASPTLGLLAEALVGLSPTTSGQALAQAPEKETDLVLSNQSPPTVDLSIPPTLVPTAARGITAGWRIPTGAAKMRFWLQNGASAWSTDMLPAVATGQPSNANGGASYTNGVVASNVVPPFLLSGPGTAGTAPTSTTANNTGVQISTNTPALVRLSPGQSFTVQASVVPAAVAVGD